MCFTCYNILDTVSRVFLKYISSGLYTSHEHPFLSPTAEFSCVLPAARLIMDQSVMKLHALSPNIHVSAKDTAIGIHKALQFFCKPTLLFLHSRPKMRRKKTLCLCAMAGGPNCAFSNTSVLSCLEVLRKKQL